MLKNSQKLEKTALTIFRKSKMSIFKIDFFFFSLLALGERMCYNSHTPYVRVLTRHNAKAPRASLKQILPTTDADTHTWPCHF